MDQQEVLGGVDRTYMTRFELSLQTAVDFWLFTVLDLMSWLNGRCESIIFTAEFLVVFVF
jgi:hypothetical protein